MLLRGIRRGQVRRGQVVAAPGSQRPRDGFAATVLLLSSAEGGRRTPVVTGYQPQFFIRTASVPGLMDLGVAGSAAPGEQVAVTVRLGRALALETGLGFVIREGGRTVGAGTITALPG